MKERFIRIVCLMLFLPFAFANHELEKQRPYGIGDKQWSSLKMAVQEAKLTAGDGAVSDFFGFSVSLSGDRALVGAHLNDDQGNESGTAYVFDYDGMSWSQSAKLSASDGAASDRFGFSVSLSGNRALVGAYQDDDNGSNSGSAYVFDYDGMNWSQSAKLIADDGAASDYFGYSVSLSGNRALVGAYLDDDHGSNSGSAYVFDYDGVSWSQNVKLTAADGVSQDNFGLSVSLSGDRALIGAYLDDDNGSASGSAYVFDYNGMNWSQSGKLTASDGTTGDNFGISVSLSGERALVGALYDDDNGNDSGSAYVFDHDGMNWSQSVKLTAGDGAANDYFGFSVSLSGNNALVGAHRDDDNGNASGSAYVFGYEGMSWSQSAKLVADDGAASDYFGYSVSLSGDRALVGAYQDDDNGSGSGSAYVVNIDPRYDINVSVSGLASGTLSVINGGDSLDFIADGTQVLSTLNDGSAYDVDIIAQPSNPDQQCSFDNADAGTINGVDVTVNISCVTLQYDVNISVTGLASTNSITFANGADTATFKTNETQTISTLDDSSAFNVSITSGQPNTPDQVCSFTNSNSGTLNGADVEVTVACVTTQYSIGGQVSGLAAGNEVVLQNNTGDDLTVTTNGSFTFATALDDESAYSVTVLSDPTTPNQTCVVTGGTNGDGSGVLAGGDDNSLLVTCATNQYYVGGLLTGLIPGNSIELQNNMGDDLLLSEDGAFVFSMPLDDGSGYEVTIQNQPINPVQPCVVMNPSGVLSGNDIDDILVECDFGDDLIFRHGFEDFYIGPSPSIDYFTINGQSGGITINPGETVNISWATTDVGNCTASANPLNQGWNGPVDLDGVVAVLVNETTTFTLSCDNLITTVDVTVNNVPNCSNTIWPPNLSKVEMTYAEANGGNEFGTSTNSHVLESFNIFEFLSLSNVSTPNQNFRRRILFASNPTNHNPNWFVSVSISQCPGDFTSSAVCQRVVFPASQPAILVSTNPQDDPNLYCLIEPNTTYFLNFVHDEEPYDNTPGRCQSQNDTECGLFFSEHIMN